LCKTADALPRTFSQTCAVPFKLKRRLGDANDYAFQTISPFKVHRAAEYLTRQPVYQDEHIVYSPQWGDYAPGQEIPFTLGDRDINEEDEEMAETSEK